MCWPGTELNRRRQPFQSEPKPFSNQQLDSSRWPQFCDHSVTSADVRLSVGWRNDELKICIVCLSFPHAILLVADLLHPVDHLAVFLFLNGDVGHGCGSRGPMPVLLAGREPNDVAGSDLLDGSAFSLHPAAAAVTSNVCPRGCVCHAVRALGS